MKRILSMILILLLCAAAGGALAEGATVTATGSGSITLAPDMASFSAGITTQDALVATGANRPTRPPCRRCWTR